MSSRPHSQKNTEVQLRPSCPQQQRDSKKKSGFPPCIPAKVQEPLRLPNQTFLQSLEDTSAPQPTRQNTPLDTTLSLNRPNPRLLTPTSSPSRTQAPGVVHCTSHSIDNCNANQCIGNGCKLQTKTKNRKKKSFIMQRRQAQTSQTSYHFPYDLPLIRQFPYHMNNSSISHFVLQAIISSSHCRVLHISMSHIYISVILLASYIS